MTQQSRLVLFLSVLLAFALLVGSPSEAAAQSGATLTPDRRTFLVNKDLGVERWTISAGLATDDVDSIVSMTGNVFQADGSPPRFVLCQVRSDSTGNLLDLSSVFRLTCRGTDACQTSARVCARDDWRPIADLVEIPAGFFLPPGGLGGPPQVAAGAAGRLGRGTAWLRGEADSEEQVAQEADRGATLSLDRLSYLVNKDVGQERWSISLNFVPTPTTSGGTTNRLLSVTGNVYFPDGRAPSFVHCSVREDSTGTLEDTASEFRFRCSGTSACTDDAEACAARSWTPIADDIRLGAAFFLPPGGLPPSTTSDPEILVIGRTSDPPSIVTKDFSLGGAAAAAPGRAAGGAACPVGETCLANRVGSCSEVPGTVVDVPEFGCGCQLDDIPATCIVCGGGASGSCGATGEYPVGSATARGVCLPFSAQSAQCLVYAVDASGTEDTVVESCGGALGTTCPGNRCCADDPSDGCSPSGGATGCSGICVTDAGCDPASDQCGSCFPSTTPTPAPRCGDGILDATEECDGSSFACDAGFTCNGNCRCTPDSPPLPTPKPTPSAPLTPSPLPSPQPTPTAGAMAPVVTSFTCNGADTCSFPAGGVEFTLSFSFFDPDGNASGWSLYLDGDLIASDTFGPTSSGSANVNYVTGDCPVMCCVEGSFAYTVIVEDSGGLMSDLAGPVIQTTEATCP